MLKYQFPAVKGYQAGKEYYIWDQNDLEVELSTKPALAAKYFGL